eukprot:777289_1
MLQLVVIQPSVCGHTQAHFFGCHAAPLRNIMGNDQSSDLAQITEDSTSSVEKDIPLFNFINEIQFLNGHSDVIRFLVHLHGRRFVSASDDGVILVWSSLTGQLITILRGHTMSITALLALNPTALVSGSADKTLRIWCLSSNECMVLPKAHRDGVKVLSQIDDGSMFVSGGVDCLLCLWSSSGDLLRRVKLGDRVDNIHAIIPLRNLRVAVASDFNCLITCDLASREETQLTRHHRESIQILLRVGDNRFISASIDGIICIWGFDDSESGSPRMLLKIDKFCSTNDSPTSKPSCRVCALHQISRDHVAATIGKRFIIIHVASGHIDLEVQDAHHANITALTTLSGGRVLVTTAADATVRLWSVCDREGRARKCGSVDAESILIADLPGHCYPITCALSLGDFSFATADARHNIILWKDGARSSEIRNVIARNTLDVLASETKRSPSVMG